MLYENFILWVTWCRYPYWDNCRGVHAVHALHYSDVASFDGLGVCLRSVPSVDSAVCEFLHSPHAHHCASLLCLPFCDLPVKTLGVFLNMFHKDFFFCSFLTDVLVKNIQSTFFWGGGTNIWRLELFFPRISTCLKTTVSSQKVHLLISVFSSERSVSCKGVFSFIPASPLSIFYCLLMDSLFI